MKDHSLGTLFSFFLTFSDFEVKVTHSYCIRVLNLDFTVFFVCLF